MPRMLLYKLLLQIRREGITLLELVEHCKCQHVDPILTPPSSQVIWLNVSLSSRPTQPHFRDSTPSPLSTLPMGRRGNRLCHRQLIWLSICNLSNRCPEFISIGEVFPLDHLRSDWGTIQVTSTSARSKWRFRYLRRIMRRLPLWWMCIRGI